MSEGIKPIEGDEEVKPIEGDETEDDSNLDELFQDGETEAEALERINKATKKDFKSLKAVAESLIEADKKFSQKGMEDKKEPVKQEVAPTNNMSERLLRLEHPEVIHVLDELKEDAKGKDVLEIYESSPYYRKKALAIAEEKENAKKISNPSGEIEKNKTLSEEEQRAERLAQRMPKGFQFPSK